MASFFHNGLCESVLCHPELAEGSIKNNGRGSGFLRACMRSRLVVAWAGCPCHFSRTLLQSTSAGEPKPRLLRVGTHWPHFGFVSQSRKQDGIVVILSHQPVCIHSATRQIGFVFSQPPPIQLVSDFEFRVSGHRPAYWLRFFNCTCLGFRASCLELPARRPAYWLCFFNYVCLGFRASCLELPARRPANWLCFFNSVRFGSVRLRSGHV